MPLHAFDQLFANGGGTLLKLRSLVKGGTPESSDGADDPGPSISPTEIEVLLLPRLTFEDLVAATALAGLALSGCRALRAAK